MMQQPHRVLGTDELAQRAREDAELIKEPSCLKCARLPVCILYRTIAPFLAQSFPPTQDGKDTRPFKPEELAKVCNLYAPPSVAPVLTP